MSEQLSQQETISEKEKLAQEIEVVISEMQAHYEWGGGENEEGVLEPGIPDFEEAKKKIRRIILGNTE